VEQQMSNEPTTDHLFWARELVRLARVQAAKKGVPDHLIAKAMLVQSYMLFTGQSERDSSTTVKGLYANSMAKHLNDKQAVRGGNSESSAVHSPAL
jgi:hypothetical protein